MVVLAAREDVRRREALLGQPRAVGTAANDRVTRLDARPPDRLERPVDHLRMAVEHGAHVPVLLLRRRSRTSHAARRRRSRPRARRTSSTCSSSFSSSWSRAISQRVAFEATPSSRSGWTNPSRPSVVSGESSRGRARDDVCHQLERVHEPVLRRAGVDADAVDRQHELVRGEGLALDLAETGAVERVGEVGAECVEVEVVRAPADLLVHREGDARGRARLVLGEQAFRSRDDDRDPGLVVRAEEGRPVARHEVVAAPLREARDLGGIQDLTRIARQDDRLPVPVAVHDRSDVRAGRRRRGVDVGDQPDGGRLRTVPGTVANTYPGSVSSTSSSPISRSSSTRRRQRSSCSAVDGYVAESGSDCVSTTTYRRNRSSTSSPSSSASGLA